MPIIFGAQWGEAVFAVQALAAVALVASIGNMQAALIQSVGQAGWWFTYRVAVQLAGFAIILAMAPLGLNAVVTGLVLRIAILWPMSLWRALRIIDTGLAQFADVLRSPALAAAGMVAVLGGVRAVLPDAFPPVWSCLALIGSGAASYIMILTYLARDQIGPVWKSIRHARKEQAV